jgi:hypothetical protein
LNNDDKKNFINKNDKKTRFDSNNNNNNNNNSNNSKNNNSNKKQLKMFEISDGFSSTSAMFNYTTENKKIRKIEKTKSNIPMSERLKNNSLNKNNNIIEKKQYINKNNKFSNNNNVDNRKTSTTTREISFYPKNDVKKNKNSDELHEKKKYLRHKGGQGN